MKSILEYCIKHHTRILEYNQDKFGWAKYKVPPLIDILDFNECIKHIPTEINRADILTEFKKANYYKGYLMTMLWGSIGMQPNQKGVKTTTNAYKAFSIPAYVIEKRLIEIKKEIDSKNIANAYSLLKGKLKFDGIDVSFFTKLLSFLSEINTPSQNLLIYDKWTKLIHVHLLLDNKYDPLKYYTKNSILNLYKPNKQGTYQTNLINTKKEAEIIAYQNYVSLMYNLSNSITENCHISLTPFQLEAFLFGKSLKSNNLNDDNPRYWVQQNFANHYLPNFNL